MKNSNDGTARALALLALIFIGLVALLSLIVVQTQNFNRDCNAAGGMVIDSMCVDPSSIVIIEINNK